MTADHRCTAKTPRLQRLLTGVVCALVATISCGREPTGPGGGALPIAGLSWLAQFPDGVPALQTAGSGGVLFSKVHVVMRLPSGVLALDTLVDFPGSGTDLQLTLSVSLPATAPDTGQTLSLKLDYLNDAGETVFTGGPVKVTVVPVKDGSGPPPPSPVTIPLVYTGTGSRAKSVVIAPLTHQLGEGDSLVYTAQAMDSAGAVIPNTPVVFSVADTTLLSIDAVTGRAKARDKRGATTVTAKLLTGPSATAALTLAPVAATLTKVSGDAQAGIITQALSLPLVVRVLARDSLPMSGVTVNFAATKGGSVTASAVTDTAGLASVAWTLGDTLGVQNVTAAVGTTVTTTFAATAGTGVPKSVLALSGDAQTALAGTTLPLPFVVKAADQYGNGVSGVTVSWAVTAGGGTLTSLTTTTDASGLAQNTLTLGTAVGVNTVVAENLAVDSIPVTFTATGISPLANVVWKGTTSSAWDDPSNWFPAVLPAAGDSVLIQAGGSQPVLDANRTLRRLTVQPGATLDVSSYILTVGGNVDAGTTITGSGTVILAGKTGTFSGAVSASVVVADTSTYTLSGTALVSGSAGVTILGTLDAGGHTLGTSALAVTGAGVLRMANAADSVIAEGSATFAGSSAATNLTAGLLAIGGDLTQSTNPHAFAATAPHTTVLAGTALQTITFANPGTGGSLSHFGALKIDNISAEGVTFASDAYADGQVVMTSALPHKLSGSNALLTTMGANVNQATFDNLRWRITDGAAISGNMADVTFQAMNPAASYFTMSRAGDATAYPGFTNWSFSPVPTVGVGQYMDLRDVVNDANALTVTMTGTNPLLTDGFVRLNGGSQPAVLNGWGNTSLWTGAVSTSWIDPLNWSPAFVPTTTTSARIPAGTPNVPTISGDTAFVKDLTVDPNAVVVVTQGGNGSFLIAQGNLTIGAGGKLDLQNLVGDGVDGVLVFGNLTTDTLGTTGVTGCSNGSGVVAAYGTGQITGKFCDLYLNSDYTAVGPMVVNGRLYANGNFNPNGNSVSIVNELYVTGSLTMSKPADSVTVMGAAYFFGSTGSTLTNGKLVLHGDFQESGQLGNTFNATAGHTTILAGTGTQNVLFFHIGTGASSSHFGTLRLANDTTQFGDSAYVDGQVIANDGATHTLSSTSSGFYDSNSNTYIYPVLVAKGADLNHIDFDNFSLRIEDGAAIGTMNDVVFTNSYYAANLLTIARGGADGPYTLTNFNFGFGLDGGYFLVLNDTNTGDGSPLTVNMSGTSPANQNFYTLFVTGIEIINGWPP